MPVCTENRVKYPLEKKKRQYLPASSLKGLLLLFFFARTHTQKESKPLFEVDDQNPSCKYY